MKSRLLELRRCWCSHCPKLFLFLLSSPGKASGVGVGVGRRKMRLLWINFGFYIAFDPFVCESKRTFHWCGFCLLLQVDRLIGKDHLFKRSIILIKTWCYYESRILGAHHGLISTYALETLVLYIFHFFHSTLDGPLAVSSPAITADVSYFYLIYWWA